MSPDSGSQPPVPGMLLVALVLSTVLFVEPPLEGSRPKEPSRISDLSSGEQVIPARLWQDPFEAIALNRAYGKPVNDLAGKVKPPTLPAADEPVRQCSYNLAEIRPTSEQKRPFGALLVMTPASPYIEDGERRMRARYAVVSALGVAGLSPRDSQHVGCSRITAGDEKFDNPFEFDMPFEWFDPPDKGKQLPVLVAWLPEEKFSLTPLRKLNNVVSQLRVANSSGVSIAVVGPHKSGTLNDMRIELLNSTAEPELLSSMRSVKFYSPSATIDECNLLREENGPQGETGKNVCKSFSELYTELVYHEPGREGFIRTIVSDSVISEALVDELELRGLELNLYKRNRVKKYWLKFTEHLFQDASKKDPRNKDSTYCSVFDGHRDHVVLISELDTLFGRSFPKAFIHAASGHDLHSMSTMPENTDGKSANDHEWIHRFSYLRGLDGQVPAKMRGGKNSAPTRSKITSGKEGAELQSNIKRAASTPRFDYLRRLAHRIERLDDNLHKHYCGSVKAIGILGSDVYDKLLILQALREKFPNTLFFTADMDARYLHPAEFKWTRNLIVASSHGLEPDAAFRTDIPPFRDSYQTSRFLATLFALSDAHKTKFDIESVLMPRIYEIGRTAARELTSTSNHPGSKNRNTSESEQEDLVLADLFQSPKLEGIKEKQQGQDSGDTYFASMGVGYKSYLQVHPVQAERRFDLLLEDNSPGRFFISGSVLATALAILGIGYYVLNYFGLHPVRYMRDNRGSLMSLKTEMKIDVPLMMKTAILWATFLLVGLSNLTVFLLIGALIMVFIVIGRVSGKSQERVLDFLQARRFPVKLALWVLAGAFVLAVYLAIQENGSEPFSFSDGISMWPGEAIRVLAGSLSIIFMLVGWISLKEDDDSLTKMFLPSVKHQDIKMSTECARIRRVDWCSGKDKLQKYKDSPIAECTPPFNAETDWKHYLVYRTLPERWNSVLFPATLFFLLGCISIYWLDDLHVPYRGEFIYRLDHVVVFGFMVPAFVLLLFSVIDETSLCVGWIRRLAKFDLAGTSHTLLHTHDKMGDQELDRIWIRLQIVAQRTRRVNKLITYPFVVIFLILVSQSPYFDNWDIPFGLIIMIALSVAYATLCAIKLRKASEEIRDDAIRELTERLIQCGGNNDKIKLLLAEIRQLKDGAFLPWTRQPLLKAMFWLLGGLGIMGAEFISLGAMG